MKQLLKRIIHHTESNLVWFGLSMLVMLGACSKKLYPPSEPYTYIYADGDLIQMRVEPYVNGMPGAQSNDVIIGIHFDCCSNRPEPLPHDWPRKLKITKIRLSGVDKAYTELEDLDHNEWMHSSLEKYDYNVLRVPIDVASYQFSVTIWLKDDKGKRYKTTFHSIGAGVVH